jgi:hypothetical protein
VAQQPDIFVFFLILKTHWTGARMKDTAPTWPAANVVMWAVEDLVPYTKNARRHPPEQIEQLAASMRRFGFTIPLLVSGDSTLNSTDAQSLPGSVKRQQISSHSVLHRPVGIAAERFRHGDFVHTQVFNQTGTDGDNILAEAEMLIDWNDPRMGSSWSVRKPYRPL